MFFVEERCGIRSCGLERFVGRQAASEQKLQLKMRGGTARWPAAYEVEHKDV